jgi:hypothetical protein
LAKIFRQFIYVPPTPETTGPQQLNPSGPKEYFNMIVTGATFAWEKKAMRATMEAKASFMILVVENLRYET